MTGSRHPNREGERGQTIILIVLCIAAFLAMAMLAIDVVTLYNASTEAQRVADAAALAGAKTFVTSGYTTSQLGDPTDTATLDLICGASGAGTLAAAATAAQNQIAGSAATVTNVNCPSPVPSSGEDPQITVTVQSSPLPTLFSRIFSRNAITASATSTAEAFNPAGTTTPISVTNIKPWAIPNCLPSTTQAVGTCANSYAIRVPEYVLQNQSGYVGQSFPFALNDGSLPQSGVLAPGTQVVQYYQINMPTPTLCPPDSQTSCSEVSGGDNYLQSIACQNVTAPATVTCGEMIGQGDPLTVSEVTTDDVSVENGVQCLIHASGPGAGLGQDVIAPGLYGAPVTIQGGANNLNPLLKNVPNISRSDSVVSVPIYDGTYAFTCAGNNPCTGSAPVIGFLQLAIQDVQPYTYQGVSRYYFDAVILNVAACNPNPTNSPVTGGGMSPIPVRLITPTAVVP